MQNKIKSKSNQKSNQIKPKSKPKSNPNPTKILVKASQPKSSPESLSPEASPDLGLENSSRKPRPASQPYRGGAGERQQARSHPADAPGMPLQASTFGAALGTPCGWAWTEPTQALEVLGFLMISLDFSICNRIRIRILQGNWGPRRSLGRS